MTFPLTLQRNGSRLEPMNPIMEEFLLEYPAGVDLKCIITRMRSLVQNAYYWKGLSIAVENMPDELVAKYPIPDKLHKALLMALGYVETVYGFDGQIYLAPDSTAFKNMSAAAFSEYFNRAQDKLTAWLGWNPWEAMKEQVA